MDRQAKQTDELREKLTNLLADWGAEMSYVLRQLEQAEAEVTDLRARQDDHDTEIQQLSAQADSQSELIEELKKQAGETRALNDESREKGQQIERLKSEIESKQELVRALRRDAEGIDRLTAELREKDDTIEELRAELDVADSKTAALRDELEALKESSDAEEHAELSAVTAELEARKTLIRSLRADCERLPQLEAELESKRAIVTQLEESMDQHAETIASLRRNSDMWRRKYHALKSGGNEATSTELPTFTNTDIAAMQQLEEQAGGSPDHTVAIDMRRSLVEARQRTIPGRGR